MREEEGEEQEGGGGGLRSYAMKSNRFVEKRGRELWLTTHCGVKLEGERETERERDPLPHQTK